MVSYAAVLALASVVVAGLEQVAPARPSQAALRPALASDLAMLLFNGHFLGVGLAWLTARTLEPWFGGFTPVGLADAWPVPAQVVAAIVAIDGMQWCVHVLLHRVPFLWEVHKVHHSVRLDEMDWIVAFRFHWFEVVVYRTLLYVPLALLGFAPPALFAHAVVGTVIGHLNHANLDWSYGPLRYILNNPRMHLWHHARDGRASNFGIIFSFWDWAFGTARLPDQPPPALGYEGDERIPRDFPRLQLWPLFQGGPR